MENAESFNILIIINTVTSPGYVIKEKSVACIQHLATIIKIITSKTNL